MDMLRGLRCEQAMDYENGFYWFADPNRMGKLCAQYELYKRIVGLPGDIVETGVFKASTLIRLATFRSFFEATASRTIYAFDAFGKFPCDVVSLEADAKYACGYDARFGEGLSAAEIDALLAAKGIAGNVHYVEGDICSTMPAFFEERPDLPLAFVHVDVEVYEPTRTILECCWERLVPSGLLLLDDYNQTTGAAKAIKEFFRGRPGVRFEKLPLGDSPTFICKTC